jgi:glucose-6-phosphate isomerase
VPLHFDQWGVELGKQLTNSILEEMNTNTIQNHDSSTSFLLNHFFEIKELKSNFL